MSGRALHEAAPPSPLALSFREAARLLGVDRGETLHGLIRAGYLRPVRWGNSWRVPLEQVEQLARTGFTLERAPRRSSPRPKGDAADPAALRRLNVESLRRAP